MGVCCISEVEPIQQPKPCEKAFSWRFWIFQIVLLAILAVFTIHGISKQRKKVDQVKTISSLRGIGFALAEFEDNFGSYPCDGTAKLVAKQFPKQGHDLSGTSSNALFLQFFAAGLTETEQMFYAKTLGVRKPDGDTSPGKLLEKGELGFAYVAGLTSEGNPASPIVFAPIIPGTTKFDPEPFEGRAVFLRVDNSVSSLVIGEDGHCRSGGIDIFSPENPIWDGKAPDIRYPEL